MEENIIYRDRYESPVPNGWFGCASCAAVAIILLACWILLGIYGSGG